MKQNRPLPPTVLILDDDACRRKGLACRLTDCGYQVAEAASVNAAIRLLGEHTPQAMVLAQRVRDGTALDVVDQVRSGPRPYVIVHGDWPATSLPQRPVGVDACLPQPVLERDVARLLALYAPRERCCGMPGVRRGDHLLLLYEGRAQLLDSLAMYVTCGLAEGERCIIACVGPAEVEETRIHFERSGVDVERGERNQSLILVTHSESYLVGGRFAPQLVIGFVRDLVAAAVVDGFTGLRAAGEGAWLPSTPEDREAWFHYELEIQSLFHGCPLTGMCLYDRTRFADDVQLEALHTHPAVLDGRAVCENLRYRDYRDALPPFVSDPAGELERRLSEVRRARRVDG